MDKAEVVHMLQATRNTNQLSNLSARLLRGQVKTHEFGTIDIQIPLDEVVDVPIFHPLGNQSESVFTHCHSKERQDVGMPEVFPNNTLPTEPLRSIRSERCDVVGRRLTLRMMFRSLVTYMRTTLTATWRPLYVLCDTSAKPPHSTSTEPPEQSGMFMDFGITPFRLHALQS